VIPEGRQILEDLVIQEGVTTLAAHVIPEDLVIQEGQHIAVI
jgi:hypothetical protein